VPWDTEVPLDRLAAAPFSETRRLRHLGHRATPSPRDCRKRLSRHLRHTRGEASSRASHLPRRCPQSPAAWQAIQRPPPNIPGRSKPDLDAETSAQQQARG
jgi:hypothetical protein